MGRLDDSEAIAEHNQNRRKTYEENDGITACIGFDLLVCYVGDGGNGPKKTFTVGTGIKSDESDEPYLEITEFSTSGAGYFVFWVTNNSNDTQVSPAYYPNSAGVKTIYYMQESRKAGYVKANVSYSARARTNSSVPTNAQSTLVAVFAP